MRIQVEVEVNEALDMYPGTLTVGFLYPVYVGLCLTLSTFVGLLGEKSKMLSLTRAREASPSTTFIGICAATALGKEIPLATYFRSIATN